MSLLLAHLVVIPIVLPLLTTALLLLLGDQRKRLKSAVNVLSSLAGLVVAATILWRVDAGGGPARIHVYLAGNWEAPFGIVLVADRLAALMLVLVGIVSVCAALYAEAGWSRAGVYFHPLFQVQLMGLNGAFLTGDLFNLFVFFEVMLAASYGLQLHGSGWPRVRSGMHYIVVNLLASSLFLVGLAVLYGVTGTLNMADVASRLASVPAADRGLLHAGAAILAMAFLIKAAIYPLNAWLVPAYSAASAPVAALFAIMTKVGIYTILRLWTLYFTAESSGSIHFGQPMILWGGIATLAFGAVGLLASMRLGHIAAFAILVSSGTLLAAIGVAAPAVTSGALFYILSATLAVSALFLLVEPVERTSSAAERPGPGDVDFTPGEETNLDDEELPLVGLRVPVSLAMFGLAFMSCALVVAGLPPLSGFVAKFSILSALLETDMALPQWVFFGVLLLSGLSATISLSRAGIRHFWSSRARSLPELRWAEAVAVTIAVSGCVLLAVGAEKVVRYTSATAVGLHQPDAYIDAVLSTRPRPGPATAVSEEPSP